MRHYVPLRSATSLLPGRAHCTGGGRPRGRHAAEARR